MLAHCSRACAILLGCCTTLLAGPAAHGNMLTLKPLPEGSTPEQFSQRVSTALELHLPFLARPYTQAQIAEWVVKQAPREHGVKVRHMFANLSAEDKIDGHIYWLGVIISGHIARPS